MGRIVGRAAGAGAAVVVAAGLLATVLLATVLLATALVAGLGGAPAQAARPERAADDGPCPMSVVPLPPGLWDGTVQAVEPSGRWQMGTAQDAAGQPHVVLWDNGTPLDLGATHIGPMAVNGDGTVVGGTITGDTSDAWVYRDGQFSTLPGVRDGDLVSLFDINDDGTVVGRSVDLDDSLGTPARWSPAGAVEALQLLPGDNYGQAEAVDGDGSAVGVAGYDARDTITLTRHPVVWQPDGSALRLPLPADAPDLPITLVAIRDGAIIGNQETSGGGPRVLRWDSATAAPHALTDGTAEAVSGNGAIALRANDSSLWLLRDQARRELTNPSSDPMMNPAALTGVTDAGVVYGAAYYLDGRPEFTPLRWDCA